jgi:meso-butanediol dehydrogenase/(S,S)-butanediol dehydrogenase/diacetyl reductase
MGDGVHAQMAPLLAQHPAFAAFFAPALPVGRMQPADISPAVAYLASDDSHYVTGCALPVDAGNASH